MNARLHVVMWVLGIVMLSCVVNAEIPQVISYQGKVTDASGNPIADGNYPMRFRIYDAVGGGTLLWDSGDVSVAVAGGVLSVLLGESPQPALTLDFNQDYWLDVAVGGDAQSPRVRMGSVGYAYMASGLVAGTEVSDSVTTGTSAAIKGSNTAESGSVYGLFGECASGSGAGVCGAGATGVYGEGITYGVHGTASVGAGVYGDGPMYGVYAVGSAGGGRGVYGNGPVAGVVGSGGETGVIATGTVYGVDCTATNTAGTTYGGRFQSSSTTGLGVYGNASATSGTTYGVYGESASTAGCGVYGYVSATRGITYGVYGSNASTDGYGVRGSATATSGVTCGVWGERYSSNGFGVWYSGGLGGSGTKSCVVKTSRGPTLLYCQESPENWFEDFGEGALVDGRCHVELDPLFLETVTIDAVNAMHVFIQPYDQGAVGVVVQRHATGFEVVNLSDQAASGAFSYRVVAKRKGFEAKRLDYCAAAERDSYLYPELREKERLEYEARNSE